MDTLISNTVFWLVTGLFALGFVAVPVLRAVAMLATAIVTAVHSIEGWVRSRPLGAGPERPLELHGLSPQLADFVRQTRFLSLELRRYSEQAAAWPEAPPEGRQSWWSALVGVSGYESHTMATRETWEWVRALDALPDADRERLSGVGIDPTPIRELLGADLGAAPQVQALTGVVASFDDRIAALHPSGYRGAEAHPQATLRGSAAPLALPGHRASEANLPGEPTDAGETTDAGEQDQAADDPRGHRERRFAEVQRRHSRALARIAGSYSRSPSEREDLEQEIALALWQALPRFRGESSLKTFVYRIARYCCYRLLRRRGRLPVEPLASEPGDPEGDLEAWLSRIEDRDQLARALARLPEGPRSTLSLHLEGKSYAEIAAELGISERNVSVRLVRARQRIAAELQAAA